MFLKKLFGSKKEEQINLPKEFTQEQYQIYSELKEKGLEAVLGKMHNIIGHAIIPFAVGGAVDMYYFPNHIQGTGFATMELLNPDGLGPKPNRLGTYELVAFTKEIYNSSDEAKTAFDSIERRVCGIFTSISRYATQVIFNPKETCEIPTDEETICVVFDKYSPNNVEFKVGNRIHHLLLCLEIFKSEMLFARENGSVRLLEMLKEHGYYPYSDLNREPVV